MVSLFRQLRSHSHGHHCLGKVSHSPLLYFPFLAQGGSFCPLMSLLPWRLTSALSDFWGFRISSSYSGLLGPLLVVLTAQALSLSSPGHLLINATQILLILLLHLIYLNARTTKKRNPSPMYYKMLYEYFHQNNTSAEQVPSPKSYIQSYFLA